MPLSLSRSAELWEEAIRIAQVYGDTAAFNEALSVFKSSYEHDTFVCQVAYNVVMNGDFCILQKFDGFEGAMNHALALGHYEDALDIAKRNLPDRIPEVHARHAMCLEDEGRFVEAEEHFILAGLLSWLG